MEPFTNTITPLELADCLGGMTIQGVYKALKTHNIPTQITIIVEKLYLRMA